VRGCGVKVFVENIFHASFPFWTIRIKLQKVVFPEGLTYDYPNQVYLTKRINSIILCIGHLAQVSDKKKALNFALVKQNSARVAPSGIEPLSKVPETFVLSIKLRGHYYEWAANI
jgi:hypothetical protein